MSDEETHPAGRWLVEWSKRAPPSFSMISVTAHGDVVGVVLDRTRRLGRTSIRPMMIVRLPPVSKSDDGFVLPDQRGEPVCDTGNATLWRDVVDRGRHALDPYRHCCFDIQNYSAGGPSKGQRAAIFVRRTLLERRSSTVEAAAGDDADVVEEGRLLCKQV